MTRSDRDPDAYDRIRDDVSVLGRTCGYCGFTGDMMAYAQHVCPRDVMQSEIDSLRAQLARANAKDSEKTRDINLLTQENRQQAAQLAAATERERAAQYQCGECGEVHETWLYAMECCADQDEAAAQPASDGQEGK